METIRIFCFSDILCIWAYIAQIRLDELQNTFKDQVALQYHFVSVFGNAREKLEKGWCDRGGLSAYSHHVKELTQKFSHIALHPDIWTQSVPASSISCHLFLHALQLLEQKGVVPKSDKILEKAIKSFRENFFGQLKDISDRKVQYEIAEDLGLPLAAIQAQIDSGEAYAKLSNDFDLVKIHTITVSPTLIFNEGRQRLNGNVGYRVLEANIRELLHAPPGEASWC